MTEETKKSKETKDPNFVSVRLPDDVAKWLRDYATDKKLVRADKPNMGGSIIAIVRAAMSGQTISNNVGQSSAPPDVDIESMIESQIIDIRKDLDLAVTSAIAPLLARLEALETVRSEATAPEKKLLSLSPNQRERAKQKVKISA